MRLGFGTWPLGGNAYGPVEDSIAVEALKESIELGCRMFDTSDIYGNGAVERKLGTVIPKSDEFTVMTKAGYLDEFSGEQDFSENYIVKSAHESLKRLRRNELDALLLHSPPRHILEEGSAFQTLQYLKVKGIAKSIGVSLRSVEDFDIILRWKECSVVQVVFNLLDQRLLDNEILQQCERRNIDIVARVPLCHGFLSGKYLKEMEFIEKDRRSRWPEQQRRKWARGAEEFRFLQHKGRTLAQAALSFCLSYPQVKYVIPGMKTIEQVRQNMSAVGGEEELISEELAKVRKIWKSLCHVIPPQRADKS